MTVDKATSMMTRLEYLDGSGRHVKTQERSDFKKLDGGVIATRLRITDHQRGNHYTELAITPEKVNAGIPADIFSVRSLQRGP